MTKQRYEPAFPRDRGETGAEPQGEDGTESPKGMLADPTMISRSSSAVFSTITIQLTTADLAGMKGELPTSR